LSQAAGFRAMHGTATTSLMPAHAGQTGLRAALLAEAGFTGISVEPTRVYSIEDARQSLVEAGIDVDAVAPLVDGKFMGAFIRATKGTKAAKSGKPCCAPGCCN